MNWMGVVAAAGGMVLGVMGVSLVWGVWIRRAVRQARVQEVRALGAGFERVKNARVLNGVSRRLLEDMARSAKHLAEQIEEGKA